MGEKGRWLLAVKKVFTCQSNENRRKHKRNTDIASSSTKNATPDHSSMEEVKLLEAEIEQNRHAYSVAIATAAAAEAAAVAANAAAEVVRLTASARYLGRSNEEVAAIKIQTAFRGYLARRALRALRGLVRLKSLVEGQTVKRQAAATLKYMQTLAHVHTEIRARRLKMSECNSAMARQIQQKREKELEKSRASDGEEWDDSMQSKEQLEASIQHKQEAAIRRERALAYAYSHQQTWRNNPSSVRLTTFMDPNNPRWGWTWLERWMASALPLDPPTTKEPNTDRASRTSSNLTGRGANSGETPPPKQNSRPPSRQSPSTSNSMRASTKIRPVSPRGLTRGGEEDLNSINSIQSERRQRRHSMAGSSVRDDESLASSPACGQGYMASTESARVRARAASPLAGGSSKKRLSFSGTPGGPRRHSGPPKVDMSRMNDILAE